MAEMMNTARETTIAPPGPAALALLGAPALAVSGLRTGYGKKPIIQGAALQVREGSVVAILGLNGCGKSTLIKALAGQLRAWSGEIRLFERDVTRLPLHQRARLGVGYLLQGGEVFPSLTVRENLELAAALAVKDKPRVNIERALHWFPDLRSLYKRRSGLLSGGQRQMLALAMVLVRRPSLLLLDEPSAGLAAGLAQEVLLKTREIAHAEQLTVVLVEQRQREALLIADEVLMLDSTGLKSLAKTNSALVMPDGAHEPGACLRESHTAIVKPHTDKIAVKE